MDLQNHSLASPTLGVGVLERNVSYNLPRVDVALHANFEHCWSNGVAAYGEQTHAHSHLYFIDLKPLAASN